jgi:hypothetical protein
MGFANLLLAQMALGLAPSFWMMDPMKDDFGCRGSQVVFQTKGQNTSCLVQKANDSFSLGENYKVKTHLEENKRPLADLITHEDDVNSVLQVRAYQSRKRVLHVHIHNSAGTWMCDHARSVGEKTTAWPFNCNLNWSVGINKHGKHGVNKTIQVNPDGPFTAIHDNLQISCASRMAEMAKEGVTFSMIERWLNFAHGDWCPNNFLYSIILREPVARAKTTFRLTLRNDPGSLLRILTSSLRSNDSVPDNPWIYSHAAFSNLMVRTLNGPAVMALPIRALKSEHLQIAKDRLRRFDVVLAAPTLYTDIIQMKNLAGWEFQEQRQVYTRNSGAGKRTTNTNMTQELGRLLVEHNQLDQELYEFGVELARARTAAVFHA